MIHAALDRLDEILGAPKNYLIPAHLRTSHWLGSLCVMEDCEIYGYVTPSNTKILAVVQRDEIMPLQKKNEGDIKMLFVSNDRNGLVIILSWSSSNPSFCFQLVESSPRLLRSIHTKSVH